MDAAQAKDPSWPEIYKFAKDDPIEGGPDGIDNLPLKQLEIRTETLRAGQRQQDLQIEGVKTHVDEVRAHVTHWTEKLETSSAGRLGQIAEAQLSGAGMTIEHFVKDWTMIDTGETPAPLALIEGRVPVAGDDSLDVGSTQGLIEGEAYLLFNGAGFRQLATVSRILGPNRLRIAPALGESFSFPAYLGRTDWQILPTGGALAQAGGIYRSRTLDLGAEKGLTKILLLRQEGEAEITLEWQPADANPVGDEWIECPWWRRRKVKGQIESQFLLPESGPIRFGLTAHGAVKIHWFVLQPRPGNSAAELNPNPYPRPRLIRPQSNETGLEPQPILEIAPYHSLPGTKIAGVVFEVRHDDTLVHRSSVQPVASPYQLPDGLLKAAHDYRFLARIETEGGLSSQASHPVAARTLEEFRIIAQPEIFEPLTGAMAEPLSAVHLSPFRILRGFDTLAARQFRVKRPNQTWDQAWDSGQLPPEAPMILPMEVAQPSWTVDLQARYWGKDLRAGPWSAANRATILSDLWLTEPGDGVWTVPVDGIYDLMPVGGGAAGQGPITGGGAGWRASQRRTLKAGERLPYRVGRGGRESYEGGQPSFIGDIGALGGHGFAWGTVPGSTYALVYGVGSSWGGPQHAASYDIVFPGGSDGRMTVENLSNIQQKIPYSFYINHPANAPFGGAGAGYWSGAGLTPGAAGVSVYTFHSSHCYVASAGGGGGVVRPGHPALSGGSGRLILLDPNETLLLGRGGEGYGAGGGAEPFVCPREHFQKRNLYTQAGEGVQGCIILRKVG